MKKATKKKSKVPTLADKHDAALASLRQARAKIKKLEERPIAAREHIQTAVEVAAMEVLEAHGIVGPTAEMLAKGIAARILVEPETVLEEATT